MLTLQRQEAYDSVTELKQPGDAICGEKPNTHSTGGPSLAGRKRGTRVFCFQDGKIPLVIPGEFPPAAGEGVWVKAVVVT